MKIRVLRDCDGYRSRCKYVEVEGKTYDIDVRYVEAASWRGLHLVITPTERIIYEGMEFRTFTAFTGCQRILLSMSRYSQKKLDEVANHVFDDLENNKNVVEMFTTLIYKDKGV